jgi:hypothetical protein
VQDIGQRETDAFMCQVSFFACLYRLPEW